MSSATPTVAPSTAPEAVPELRDVIGPSALGGGRRRFFDLLWLMAVTEFKRTYFGTVLGYLWSLVRPLLLFAVLLFVFTKVVKLGSSTIPHYPVVLLFGIVLFAFFTEATSNSVTSVVAQEGIVRKTQFPRLVIPLSTVLTALFNLLLNLVIVFIFILAFGISPAWSWFLFIPALAVYVVFVAAVATMLSVLYVRFRDVAIIWAVLAQVLFYLTPILYPLTLPGNQTIERLMVVNPLAPLFNEIQRWVVNPGEASVPTITGGAVWLLPALAIFLAVCAFAVWIFNRDAPRIAEDL